MANVNKNMTFLFGGLILVLATASLAPEIFSAIADMSADVNIPGWVSTLFLVIAGIGLVLLVWRGFGNK